MRTSLNKIQLIEGHLLNRLNGEEEVLFQANRILDPDFAEDVEWQKNACQLIHAYGRKEIKQEIELICIKLFADPVHQSFAQRILNIFRTR